MGAEEKKKKKPIARLKSMYPLRACVDESYKKSVEAMSAGKPTAWGMVDWWQGDAIVKAMDVEMVFPENYGAVCAADGVAQSYLERSDSAGFPTHLCGYSRNCFGYTQRLVRELDGKIPPEAPLGGMPKPLFLLSSSIICDARYKWFQGLGHYLDAPVFTLDCPIPGVKEMFQEGAYESCVNFAAKNIREFVTFLERLLGRRLDEARLAEIVDDMLEMNRIWHEVNELRTAKPCPMHSRDFWSAMPPSLYLFGDVKQAIANYKAMYDEVKAMVDAGTGAIAEEKYRLAFAELPPWHSLGFFDVLAERGWNFVIESWAYHPPIPMDLSRVQDPIEKMARHTIQHQTGYYRYALEGESTFGYMGYPYVYWAKKYQFDGAFLHPLVTCRSASTHLGYAREDLAKKMKVPSIWVEGDIVDINLFDPQDALRRAEAFEEVMDHNKEERKKAGMAW